MVKCEWYSATKCGIMYCGSKKCGMVQYKVCVQHMDGAQAGKQQTDCHPQYTARQLPPTHNTLSRKTIAHNYVHKTIVHCVHKTTRKTLWTLPPTHKRYIATRQVHNWGSQDNTREHNCAHKEMEKRVLAG